MRLTAVNFLSINLTAFAQTFNIFIFFFILLIFLKVILYSSFMFVTRNKVMHWMQITQFKLLCFIYKCKVNMNHDATLLHAWSIYWPAGLEEAVEGRSTTSVSTWATTQHCWSIPCQQYALRTHSTLCTVHWPVWQEVSTGTSVSTWTTITTKYEQ